MTVPTDLLLSNARPYGGEPIDVLIRNGRIFEIAPPGSLATPRTERIDVDGRSIGPGLWDAHVHFTQWVIQSRRLDLSGTHSAADVVDVVRQSVSGGVQRADGMLVGYGFRDALWPDAPTLAALDGVSAVIPIVLVSADLHEGWMNSAGARVLGLTPGSDGLVMESEWIACVEKLEPASAAPTLEDFRRRADAAAARGVVGIVEYETTDNAREWTERVASGITSLRIDAAVWPNRLEEEIAAGRRTGDVLDPTGLVTFGRLKVVVDGSLNTRTAWCWDPYPDLDPTSAHSCGVESVSMAELRRLLERSHAHGIAPAVHAIGDRANSEVLDLFGELGLPGAIEHAQLVREHDFSRFAEYKLIASVQPEHAMDDRDAADHHWAGRTDRAFAFGSLHRAGAQLRLGSDAPVAPLDPWQAIASATARSRGDRNAWHPEQALPVEVALAASARTTFAVGQPADLVLTEADPLGCDRDGLRDMSVAATLLGGRFTARSF